MVLPAIAALLTVALVSSWPLRSQARQALAAGLGDGVLRPVSTRSDAAPFCGVDNFAWTIPNRLARSAQPPEDAWRCLSERGVTTVMRQNLEDGDVEERRAVEAAGMEYVGIYQIPDQTAYAPDLLGAMLADVGSRLTKGERILVHDAGGRGRMGFWEAAFLMWDGWSSTDAIDRYVAFGWKVDCEKGGNGQMQAINEIAVALGQPPYYPPRDSYGTHWQACPRPAYMDGWSYTELRLPPGGGRWSRSGVISPRGA
jgi:hypothetical protein